MIHFVNSRYRDAVPVWLGTNYQMMTGSWLRVPAPDLRSLKIIQKMQPPNHQMKYTAHRKSSGLIFGLLVIRSSSWDPHLISRYFWASPGLLFNQRLFWSCFVNILLPNLRQDPPKCLMSEPDADNFGLSGCGKCFDIDTRNQILVTDIIHQRCEK